MPDPLQALLVRGYRFAMSLCGDPAQADDLLQDAWLSVRKANGPQTAPYFFRAIRSRWIDTLRKPQLFLVSDAVERAVVEPLGQRQIDDRSQLAPILAAMRPEEREVLYLCVVEGYSASEAGELLGKPRNSVLSLLHRGRARVREILDDEREVMP